MDYFQLVSIITKIGLSLITSITTVWFAR